MGHRTARLLGGLGRALITVGALLILFAAYQLWGTGLAEQRAQDELADAFIERRDALWATSTTSTTVAPPTTAPAAPGTTPPATRPPATTTPPQPVVAPELAEELRPDLGDTIGRIVMPSIGVDKYVVHGVRRADLRRGPGHYPDTPLPGQAGNAAIAGHRTTYGAPFGDLDQLQPGDEIVVETLQGTFHYEVMPQPRRDGSVSGHVIVGPDAVQVVDDFGDDRLTLTACHPKYSAAKRIVVMAKLVSPPAAAVAPATSPPPSEGEVAAGPVTSPDAEAPDTDPGGEGDAGGVVSAPDGTGQVVVADEAGETLGWDTGELPATAGWAAVTAAIAAAVAVLGRVWRRWPARLVGAPVVALALFTTFGHLDRLLPAL